MRIREIEKTEEDIVDNANSRSFINKLFRLLFYSDYENFSNSESKNEITNAMLASIKMNSLSSEYLNGATNDSAPSSK